MSRPIVTQKQMELFSKKELENIQESILHENGMEYPSSKKTFIDIHDGKRNSLKEQVNRIMNNYLIQKELNRQGYETMEEADDFDIPEDESEFKSPYEFDEMTEETYEPHKQPESLENKGVVQKGFDGGGSGSTEPPAAKTKASDSAAASE